MNLFCFDVETTGLQYGVDIIISFAIYDDGNVSVHNINSVQCTDFHLYACEYIRNELEQRTGNDWVIVNHNIKFDLRMADISPDLVDRLNIVDTQYLWHYLNPRKPNALAAIEQELFGQDVKATYHEKYGKKFDQWPVDQLRQYNEHDVKLTVDVYNKLQDDVPGQFKRYQQELLKATYRIEYSGFPYDYERAEQVRKEFEQHRDEKHAELIDWLKQHGIDGSRINFNSSKQLSILLYDTLKLPKPQRELYPRGKGYDKLFTSTLTNKDLLKTHNHPLVELYLELSALQSTLTFIKTYNSLQVGGRLYPSFNITGTVTGRMSCSKPNLQNIKKKSVDKFSPRSLFVPNKGETLVSIDYQQQEIRMLAVLSQDQNLLELVNAGTDMHSAVGCKMLRKETLSKDERDKIKGIHFG